MDKATREKIEAIHDFTIRMEPYCKDVENLKKTIYGNGKMGLRTQVIIMWGAYTVVCGLVLKALAK